MGDSTPKKVIYGEKGMRLVRTWKVLMLLAEASGPLKTQEIHRLIHDDVDFMLDQCAVSTIRDDLKALVRAGFPVRMLNSEGNDITSSLADAGKGLLKNVRWSFCNPDQVGRFKNPRHRLPTASDVLNLSLCRSLFSEQVPSDYPLFPVMKRMLDELHCRMNQNLRLGEPSLRDLQGRVVQLGKRYIGQPDERKNWDILAEAVARREVLKGRYISRAATEPRQVDLAPLAIWIDEGRSYVLAAGGTDHKIRSWRVSRFKELRVAEGVIPPEIPEEKIARLLHDSLRGFVGESEGVVLTVQPEVAYLFEEYRFHPSQETKPLPDGGVEVRLCCPVNWALEEWILGFGEHVRVFAPGSLVKSLKGRISRLSSIYEA